MSSTRRRAALAAGALLLTTLTLGGCMNPADAPADDAEQVSAERGSAIEEAMPGLVRAAGWDSIGVLREESCNDSPDTATASSETRWFAAAGRRDADADEADAVVAAVREHAESTGWSGKDSTGGPEILYAASQGDLTLVVRHSGGSGTRPLGVEISTPCQAMPEGHAMLRSELDPMYGSPSSLYPRDDRSQFTNGEPKPLPEPSSS